MRFLAPTLALAGLISLTSATNNTAKIKHNTYNPLKPPGYTTTDGTCGQQSPRGATCTTYEYGNCCSSYGWCGFTDAHCGTGCQSGFGNCYGDVPQYPSYSDPRVPPESTAYTAPPVYSTPEPWTKPYVPSHSHIEFSWATWPSYAKPTSGYEKPTSGYEKPSSWYEKPSSSYHYYTSKSTPVYSKPTPVYSPPSPVYSTPTPVYSEPPSSYCPPESSYYPPAEPSYYPPPESSCYPPVQSSYYPPGPSYLPPSPSYHPPISSPTPTTIYEIFTVTKTAQITTISFITVEEGYNTPPPPPSEYYPAPTTSWTYAPPSPSYGAPPPSYVPPPPDYYPPAHSAPPHHVEYSPRGVGYPSGWLTRIKTRTRTRTRSAVDATAEASTSAEAEASVSTSSEDMTSSTSLSTDSTDSTSTPDLPLASSTWPSAHPITSVITLVSTIELDWPPAHPTTTTEVTQWVPPKPKTLLT